MTYRITAEVSLDILNILFNDLNIWSDIKNGNLTSIKLKGVPSKTYKDATSRIMIHRTSSGKHIATTHRITDNKTGKILHWDPSNVILNDVCLFKPSPQ